MKKLLCAVALLSALCLSQARATDKLKVTIYYETLCPACMNFILTGLYPAYSELGSYLDLEMVPYQWVSLTYKYYDKHMTKSSCTD
ncbi:unnamed protein product [Acanthoscelides obtectus]|uniref:Uncharacterized protein n=1 Tax=Acanthoscelides obtectus TaxID=200917 RepID=A0A9P0L7M5_ACAOB|nr:unnamed protein product [Acanthoscelides obtectus]CAK1672465.1 hypothetical protein AOBTE_LOCUS28913 [Acanthoscelides obtectus]